MVVFALVATAAAAIGSVLISKGSFQGMQGSKKENDAVLVFGSTGKMGRAIVKEVRTPFSPHQSPLKIAESALFRVGSTLDKPIVFLVISHKETLFSQTFQGNLTRYLSPLLREAKS